MHGEPLARGSAFVRGSVGMVFAALVVSGCAKVPEDRYGIGRIRFEGMERMDARALAACLATREREAQSITFGLSGEPECGVAPFDEHPARLRLWTWPWTDWPLLDQTTWTHDRDRILRWYRARGFPDARVVETRIEPDDANESDLVESDTRCDRRRRRQGCVARITVVIEEGDPILVERLDVAPQEGGAAIEPELLEELRDAITLEVGERFDEGDYEASKTAIVALLAEEGRCHAAVTGRVEIRHAAMRADVAYRIAPGNVCRTGEITVEGQADLPIGPIVRASDLEAGHVFRPSDVHDAQRAIVALGAFATVDVVGTPSEGSDVVPIVIRVAPARRNRFLFGAGIQAGASTATADTEGQVVSQWDTHLLGRWENRNLFGGMRRLAIEDRARLVWNEQFPQVEAFDPKHNLGNVLRVDFQQPSFLEARTSLLVSAVHDFGPDPYAGFTRHAIRGGIDLSRSFFGQHLRVTAGLHTIAYRIHAPPNSPEDERRDWLSTYWQQTVELDLRDRPARTRSGAFVSLRAQEAGFGLPGDWSYVRLVPEARAYAPIGGRLVVAARLRLGMILMRDGFDGAISPGNALTMGPDVHRLRGGGPASNRGFLAQHLGDGESGGTRSWEASLEVRVPVSTNFWLVAFGDMGDVSRDDHFRWNYTQLSVGGGIRYFTIVGPIRLDLGFRVPGAQILGGASDDRHVAFCVDSETGATIDCNPNSYHGRIFGGPLGAIHLTIGDSF